MYLRFFLGSSMPFFLRSHVDAFAFFGGVPRVLLYDNLKSAVLERRGDIVRFNPEVQEIAAHYHFEVRPSLSLGATKRAASSALFATFAMASSRLAPTRSSQISIVRPTSGSRRARQSANGSKTRRAPFVMPSTTSAASY